MTRRMLGALGALALLAGGACVNRSEAAGALRVSSVAGSAEMRSETGWGRLRLGDTVPAGARVRTLGDGTVRFAAAGRSYFELAPGTQAKVLSDRGLALDRGAALAVARGPVRMEARSVSVSASKGAVRVDGDLSVTVRTYSGTATVSVGLASLPVPRLRKVVVAGQALPWKTEPIGISARDPWDRRFLLDAIDLDRELESPLRGFDAQYGARAPSGAFFARFLPLDSTGFIDPYLIQAGPADLLIGLVEASMWRGGSTAEAFGTIMKDLWLQGATWGLIAVEGGLKPFDVVVRVGQAIDRGVRSAGPSAGPQPPGPTSQPRASSSPSPRHSRSPSPSPSPSPSGLPSPVPSPACDDPITSLIDPRCQGALGPVVPPDQQAGLLGGVTGLVGGLLGALLG